MPGVPAATFALLCAKPFAGAVPALLPSPIQEILCVSSLISFPVASPSFLSLLTEQRITRDIFFKEESLVLKVRKKSIETLNAG